MSEQIRVERHGAVAVLTLDRPATLNALDRGLLEGLAQTFQQLDGEVRAVVLTGAGKAFVAGADIRAMAEMTPAEALAFSRFGQGVFDRIAAHPCPVIAAINGFALGGGCELALACDLRIGSDRAKLGLPEVGLGVVPGFGGTQRLARLVGPGAAKRLLFTGEVLGAEAALALGLLDEVVPAEDLLAHGLDLATRMAGKGPLAVARCKALVDAGLGAGLAEGQQLEAEGFAALFGTEDQREGMAAFLAKRPAAFRGR